MMNYRTDFKYSLSFRMDLNEANRPKKVYNVIEPNTNRVLEMRRFKDLKDQEKRAL